jgi:hypothetical protein
MNTPPVIGARRLEARELDRGLTERRRARERSSEAANRTRMASPPLKWRRIVATVARNVIA